MFVYNKGGEGGSGGLRVEEKFDFLMKLIWVFFITFLWPSFDSCLLCDFFMIFFMIFSLNIHEYWITFVWLSQDYFVNLSRLSLNFLYDSLMTFSWLSHDFFMTFSGFYHDFVGKSSWLSHDVIMTFQCFHMTMSWLSYDIIMTILLLLCYFLITFSCFFLWISQHSIEILEKTMVFAISGLVITKGVIIYSFCVRHLNQNSYMCAIYLIIILQSHTTQWLKHRLFI